MATYHTETKNKAAAALWKLIEMNTLEAVTITMICQEAGINRRSFYRHFADKVDVLVYSLEQKRVGYIDVRAKAQTMTEMIGLSFQFYKKQKKYLQLLSQNELLPVLYRMMQSGNLFDDELDIYMERAKVPACLREYVANVITATHTSLLMTWIEHDFQESWQELSRFELSMFSVMKRS